MDSLSQRLDNDLKDDHSRILVPIIIYIGLKPCWQHET